MTIENDPAPLFLVPRKEPEEEPEVEPTPEPPKAKVSVDPFVFEIEKIKRGASPAEKDTMDRAGCFGYGWYTDLSQVTEDDDDPGGPCLETECDLRRLCQLVYQRSSEILEGQREPEPEKTRTLIVLRKSRKKRGRPRLHTKIVPKGKWKGTGKYERISYVSAGRPVDLLAHDMWEAFGCPPSLPNSWTYPPSRTLEQRELAKKNFVKEFGDGVVVTKRMQYHQYLVDGVHLMRYWVNAAGGGWLDLNPPLARIILTHNSMDIEQTSKSGRKYRFYPYRTYVSRQRHFNRLIDALTEYEGTGVKLAKQDEPGGEDDEDSQG